jgi:hypothetical protein
MKRGKREYREATRAARFPKIRNTMLAHSATMVRYIPANARACKLLVLCVIKLERSFNGGEREMPRRYAARALLISCALALLSQPLKAEPTNEDLQLYLATKRESKGYRNFQLYMRAMRRASNDYFANPSLRQRDAYDVEGHSLGMSTVTYQQYMSEKDLVYSKMGSWTPRQMYETAMEIGVPLPPVGKYVMPETNLLQYTENASQDGATPRLLLTELNAAKTDPVYFQYASNAFKQFMGVGLDDDLSSVPEVVQIKTRMDLDKLKQGDAEVLRAMRAEAKELQDIKKQLEENYEKERKAEISAQQAEDERQELIRRGQDISSGLQVMGYMADVLGNPRLARFAYGASDRVKGIFDLLANSATMSSFTFGTSLFFQINSLGSLFDNTSAATPAEIEMLQAIMGQLTELRKEMHERFDQLTELVQNMWNSVDARLDDIDKELREAERNGAIRNDQLRADVDTITKMLSDQYALNYALADEMRENFRNSEELRLQSDADVLMGPPPSDVDDRIKIFSTNVATVAFSALTKTPFTISSRTATDPEGAYQALLGTGSSDLPVGAFATGAAVFEQIASDDVGITNPRLSYNLSAFLLLSKMFRDVAAARGQEWLEQSPVDQTTKLIDVGARYENLLQSLFAPQRPFALWDGALDSYMNARTEFVDTARDQISAATRNFAFKDFDLTSGYKEALEQEKVAPYVGQQKLAHYCADKPQFEVSDDDLDFYQDATFRLPKDASHFLPVEVRLGERVFPIDHDVSWCVGRPYVVYRNGLPVAGLAIPIIAYVKSKVWHSKYDSSINQSKNWQGTFKIPVRAGDLIMSVNYLTGYKPTFGQSFEESQKSITKFWDEHIDSIALTDNFEWAVEGYEEFLKRVSRKEPGTFPAIYNDEQDAIKAVDSCVLPGKADLTTKKAQRFCADRRYELSYFYSHIVVQGTKNSPDVRFSSPTVQEQEDFKKGLNDELKAAFEKERAQAFGELMHGLPSGELHEKLRSMDAVTAMMRSTCIALYQDGCFSNKAVYHTLFEDGPLNGSSAALDFFTKTSSPLPENSYLLNFNVEGKAARDSAKAALLTLGKPSIPDVLSAELKLLRELRDQQVSWQRSKAAPRAPPPKRRARH